MQVQKALNYERVAEAIEYLNTHFQEQPNLDQLAAKVHLSPFHFQRLFKEWAGISPKKFLQYISLEYAKKCLKEGQTSLAEASFKTGLSGTSRLHDLFVKIEGMTPGEYKNGGKNLSVRYQFATSPFGQVLIASTAKGICYLAFAERPKAAFIALKDRFPNAQFSEEGDAFQENALLIFSRNWEQLPALKLHLKGTDFQLKVWEALLKIPFGALSTYGTVAERIQQPGASRAVGTAIGQNPIAYLIPCHRVIRSSGHFGQYHWGSTRKQAIIGWEGAHL